MLTVYIYTIFRKYEDLYWQENRYLRCEQNWRCPFQKSRVLPKSSYPVHRRAIYASLACDLEHVDGTRTPADQVGIARAWHTARRLVVLTVVVIGISAEAPTAWNEQRTIKPRAVLKLGFSSGIPITPLLVKAQHADCQSYLWWCGV